MNIRRGLFRLWVVLSGLWLVGVVVASWSLIDGTYRPTKRLPDYTSSGGYHVWDNRVGLWERDKFPAPVKGERFKTTFANGVTYSVETPDEQTAGRVFDEMAATNGDWSRDRPTQKPGEMDFDDIPRRDGIGKTVFDESAYWRVARDSVAIAILPPLIALALGSALAWAFSGFRRPPIDRVRSP